MSRRLLSQAAARQLEAPRLRRLAKTLLWPYSGMVNDLIGSAQTKGNYLAALGLICYSETCGRQFFCAKPDRDNDRWLGEFLKYMGAGSVLSREIQINGRRRNFHDAVRNGLVHQYFMKVPDGGVAMTTNAATPPEAKTTGFVITDAGNIRLFVISYLHLFCRALELARGDGLMNKPWQG